MTSADGDLADLLRDVNCYLFDYDNTLVNLGNAVPWDEARQRIRQICIDAELNFILEPKGDIFSFMSLCRKKADQSELDGHVLKRIHGSLGELESDAAQKSILMPYARETLEFLKEADKPVGVVTSNSQEAVERSMSHLNIDGLVDVAVGRGEDIRIKPSPAQINRSLDALGEDSGGAGYFGDSPSDMKAAKAAEVLPIGVLTHIWSREELKEAGARKVLDGLGDLLEALEEGS